MCVIHDLSIVDSNVTAWISILVIQIVFRLTKIDHFFGDTSMILCRSHVILVKCKYSSKLNPFTPKFKKYILPTFQWEMYKWGSENWLYNYLSFVSKLWKAKFFILCDVIFLVLGLQRKFEIGSERVERIVILLVYNYLHFFCYCNFANHETK